MSSSDRFDGRGPDDHAAGQAGLLAEPLDDGPQPAALVARLDLAGHADVVDRRHVDEEPAGQAQVRRDAGALRAERFLDDLDDDLLPLLEQVLDLRGGRWFAPAVRGPGWSRPPGPGSASARHRPRPRRPGPPRRSSLGSGGWGSATSPFGSTTGAGDSSSSSSSASSVGLMTSVTYRKASRSSPRSTKADCMPGSTFETRPL